MIAVSNSSPLLNLAVIGKLDLLRHVFGAVTIPEAVWRELVLDGAGQPGAAEIEKASWIRRATVRNEHLVRALRQELDAGESEAIALALEVEDALLLMDERLGRETARHLGIRHLGLVGVLVEAKRRRFIDAVRPCLEELRDRAGFRLGENVWSRVLRDAGEL